MRWQTGRWLTFGFGAWCPVTDPEYQACLAELQSFDWPHKVEQREGRGRIWIEPIDERSILEPSPPEYERTPEGTLIRRRVHQEM